MSEYKDFYKILGVPRTASDEEIKKNYRRLAKQYHPDINKNKEAEVRFKEVSEAYHVLSDPEKRKQYDMLGQAYDRGFRGFRQAGSDGGFGGGFEFDNESMGNFGGFGNLGDLFSELFNMGGIRQDQQRGRQRAQRGTGGRGRTTQSEPGPTRGQDLIADITIPFLDAAKGSSVSFALKHLDGSNISVKIPAGIDEGAKVRVKGKGHLGHRGGAQGDLFLRIHVKPHEVFWRENSDIFCEVPITFYEAALGASISVPTLSGSANMKIPKGTTSGQKFRIKGKGVPVLGKSQQLGDQYVIVQIAPPKKLDKESEAFLKEWSEKHPYNPREST